MRVSAREVVVVLLGLLAVFVGPAASLAQGGASVPDIQAEAHRLKLYTKISLRLEASKESGESTIERAVKLICAKAGVPYQAERSRTLSKGKATASIGPLNYTNVVAGKAVVVVAGKAGLTMRIDDKGVYLVPKPKLTVAQRTRLGTNLQVDASAIFASDTVGRYSKETVQRVHVQITLKGMLAFKDLKLVTRIYSRIQRTTLRQLEPGDETRPRYGPKMDIVEVHKQTHALPALQAMEAREFKTKIVKSKYERHHYSGGQSHRHGEKYYGFVVDVYVGNEMIKSVTSTPTLHELLGRDTITGFPKK